MNSLPSSIRWPKAELNIELLVLFCCFPLVIHIFYCFGLFPIPFLTLLSQYPYVKVIVKKYNWLTSPHTWVWAKTGNKTAERNTYFWIGVEKHPWRDLRYGFAIKKTILQKTQWLTIGWNFSLEELPGFSGVYGYCPCNFHKYVCRQNIHRQEIKINKFFLKFMKKVNSTCFLPFVDMNYSENWKLRSMQVFSIF